MRQILAVLLFCFCFVSTNAEVNLKCSLSRTKSGCQCNIKIDPVTSLPATEAVCEYLGLEEIPTISSQETVNVLDLSHNNLKKLTKYDAPLQFIEMIFNLKFCHNQITEIDDNFFDSFPNLKTLDLSHNNLTIIRSKNVFDKLENLRLLDLSFNQIKAIPDGVFNNLKNLKNLDLSYNNLYSVLQNSTALMDELGINENILHLALDNVGVTRIHAKCWNSFKQIQHLSVADNPITEIPQTSSTLEYLDISGTNITNLHENYLDYANLKVLRMSRMNDLTSIPNYAFFNLGNLEELVLTDSSKVENFDEFVFGLMDKSTFPRKFKRFDLSRNKLSTLNVSYEFIFEEAENVDVSFNPWHCDCDLLWMKELDFPMKRRRDMRCASPSEVVNKLVLELQPRDRPNCYPEIYGKKVHQTALLVLIMLVFALIVVITYLCLYSPSWSIKISRTKVSPDSPYSINNEQI